jgi:hypothetical protein
MTHGVLTTSETNIRSVLKPELNRASRSQPISRFQEQEHLAQAYWHVSQIKTHIVRQRIRVKHARSASHMEHVQACHDQSPMGRAYIVMHPARHRIDHGTICGRIVLTRDT